MDINHQGSGKLSRNQAILPRNRASEQADNRTQASQQLSNTWGKPQVAILRHLINLILLLIQSLKGSDNPPTPQPKPEPPPQPTPQPVYGAIQPPPDVQPVYGAIQPPPPDVQPVYGAIQPPDAQPVYGGVTGMETPTNDKK